MFSLKNLFLALLVISPAVVYLLITFPQENVMPFGGSDSYPYISQLNTNYLINNYCGLAPPLSTPDGVQWYPQAIGFFSALPVNYAYYVYVEFHLITGAFFFYILCGYVTKKYEWKAIGAFLYGASLFPINYLFGGNLSFLTAFAYLPIILFFGMRAIENFYGMDAVIAGVYSAFLFLGGGVLFFIPLSVFFLAKAVVRYRQSRNNRLFGAVFLSIGTTGALVYNKAYFLLVNLKSMVYDRTSIVTSLDWNLINTTWITGHLNDLLYLYHSLLAPFYYAAFQGAKKMPFVDVAFFVAITLDVLGILPTFTYLVFHNSYRYVVFIYLFLILFAVKYWQEKNKYAIAIATMLVFFFFYLVTLNLIRLEQARPIGFDQGNAIKTSTANEWLVLNPAAYYEPATVFDLQVTGNKIVNPYDSVSYLGNYTCGKYYVSPYKIENGRGNLSFVNEQKPRSFFNLTNERKIGNFYVYSIVNNTFLYN